MHRILSLSIAVFMLSAAMTANALPVNPASYSACAIDTVSSAESPCKQQGLKTTSGKTQLQSASGNNGTGAFSKRKAHDEKDENEKDENEKDENEKDENEKDENEKDENEKDENEKDEDEKDEDEKDEDEKDEDEKNEH